MDSPWLWVCLLGAVIFIFSWIRSKSTLQSSQQSDLTVEMEETFERFAQDIVSDNEKLLHHIEQLKEQYEKKNDGLKQQVVRLEQELQELKSQGNQHDMQQTTLQKPTSECSESKDLEQVVDEAPENVRISERYKELFALYAQGKSIEYIAKKMNMNKGEVQLIVTLAEREEVLRAEK